MTPEEPEKTRYYDLDGCAIVWEPGKIPRVVETGDIVYEIVRFMESGRRISKSDFDRLVAAIDGRRPS